MNQGFTSRAALVTGASSGIGREFAELLARDRNDLVMVSRSAAKLEEVGRELRGRYKVAVEVLPADLADADTPQQIMSHLTNRGILVHTLVNSAGAGRLGEFMKSDPHDNGRMIQLNVTALTMLSQLFGQTMVKHGGGKILNVASTAAFQAGPLMAVYYASKAYVLSFSEALAAELRGSGVTVTVLCPGPTRSGFQAAAGLHHASDRAPSMSSADVAAIGYHGMLRGQRLVIPGLGNKALVQATRLIPRKLASSVVHRVQRSRMKD